MDVEGNVDNKDNVDNANNVVQAAVPSQLSPSKKMKRETLGVVVFEGHDQRVYLML